MLGWHCTFAAFPQFSSKSHLPIFFQRNPYTCLQTRRVEAIRRQASPDLDRRLPLCGPLHAAASILRHACAATVILCCSATAAAVCFRGYDDAGSCSGRVPPGPFRSHHSSPTATRTHRATSFRFAEVFRSVCRLSTRFLGFRYPGAKFCSKSVVGKTLDRNLGFGAHAVYGRVDSA